MTVSQVAYGKVRDVGAEVAEPRSTPPSPVTGSAIRERLGSRPKRVKEDRIPPRGCESNNGILEKLVKHYGVYK